MPLLLEQQPAHAPRMSIGEVVRRLRQARGWSLNRLATEADVDRGNLSRFENNRSGLREENLIKVLDTLGVTMAQAYSMAEHPDQEPPPLPALAEPTKNEELEEAHRARAPVVPPLAARADVIDVPVMNAEGSMGYGRLVPEQEAIIDYMRLSLSFLRRRYSITNPANLRIVIGYGDSMAPTIKNGDPVLVDVGVTDLKIDGVYVLSRGDELFIKRMQRLVGGGFEMISDNQLYKPQVIEDLEADGLIVRGRALLAWNGRDL